MRKKLIISIIVIVLGGIAFLFYGGVPDIKGTRPLTEVTIDQAAKTLLYLPLYVAIDRGYIREEGLEARVLTAGGDSQAFAALASGEAQFAQGDPTFVAISHEKGGPGIVVASVLDRVAFWGVTFDKDLPRFTEPKGFRGRTVVTYPEPNTAYVVQKDLIAKSGLQLGKDTFIIQATFGTELGPLEAGKAQMAMSIEPVVSQAVAQGASVVFSYPDAYGSFLLTGLMTTEEFAKSNPQVVQGLVNAYERSLRMIHEDPDAAIAIAKKYFPELSADVIRAAVSRLASEKVFPEHAIVDIESWKAALQLRVEVGDLKSANHEGFVDNSYAIKALGR